MRIDLIATYATEFMKCQHQTSPQLKVWEGIEKLLQDNLEAITQLPLTTLANLSMISVQKNFDEVVITKIKDASFEYLK